MSTRLMKIIKSEDKRTDHEWVAHSVKEALQMMDDAVDYQEYWNEQMSDRDKDYGRESPTKFGVWVGLFTHATMDVSMTVAKRLLKEMWENAQSEINRTVEHGTYPDGRVYAEIEPSSYSLRFHVRKEMIGDHCYQDVHDKVEALRGELIAQKREEEE